MLFGCWLGSHPPDKNGSLGQGWAIGINNHVAVGLPRGSKAVHGMQIMDFVLPEKGFVLQESDPYGTSLYQHDIDPDPFGIDAYFPPGKGGGQGKL